MLSRHFGTKPNIITFEKRCKSPLKVILGGIMQYDLENLQAIA